MLRVYTIAITLLASICFASALRCYVCNSVSDKGCEGDSLSKDHQVDCNVGRNATGSLGPVAPVPDATVCWKQRQDVDGLIIIDRTCGLGSKDIKELDSKSYFCYDRVGTKKIKVRYCICNQKECNASSGLTASFGTLALVMVACFVFSSARL